MGWINNRRGLSLVELLATVVLVSIILVIVFSIVVSSQNQNIEQTKEGQQINDAAYILKLITKDARNTKQIELLSNAYEFKLHENLGSVSIYYEYKNDELYRNNQLIGNKVKEFKVTVNDKYVDISFLLNGQAYKASLSYRKGSSS